jgi:predicted AlkP superfamily pyrophosphatase or phosphodiesterase
MKHLLICLAAFACSGSLWAADTPGAGKVVVISLDGFPASALSDPRLPIPTLRRLMHEGSYAESMRPINPTVTWPNHTAMVTGVDASVHQVLWNGELIPASDGKAPYVDSRRSKEEMVHAPTVYDLAYRAGLTTAQVDWVAINKASTITWQFPELPDPDGLIERELIAQGKVTRDQLRTFEDSSQAWQDQIWTDAAVHILKEHKPDLLLLHLLSLDTVNHEYGPGGEASFTAIAFLDNCVRRVIDALRESGQLQNTAVLIVSDHGFRRVVYAIHPQVLLKSNAALEGKVWIMSESGTASVYFDQAADRQILTAQVEKLFAAQEGVDQIDRPQQFATLGWPIKTQSAEAPDLMLIAKPGYYFSGEKSDAYLSEPEEKGNHGFLNTDPEMQAIFIAWGKNIRSENNLGAISNLEVAPTIAKLLGLTMPATNPDAPRRNHTPTLFDRVRSQPQESTRQP